MRHEAARGAFPDGYEDPKMQESARGGLLAVFSEELKPKN